MTSILLFELLAGLEINERPLKRSLLDLENLSISHSSGKGNSTAVSHLYFSLLLMKESAQSECLTMLSQFFV